MCKEEDKDMAVTEKGLEELKSMVRKITKSSLILTGKNNMIELDPTNPHHREWFEEDKYKGK